MQIDPFAGCCGMSTLRGWPYKPEPNSIARLEDIQTFCGYPNLIAILNQGQHNGWKEFLPKYGWRLLTQPFNSVHHSTLYLWLWEANPDRNPENPRFLKDIFYCTEKAQDYNLTAKTGLKKADIPIVHAPWSLTPEMREYQKGLKEKNKTVVTAPATPAPGAPVPKPKQPEPSIGQLLEEYHHKNFGPNGMPYHPVRWPKGWTDAQQILYAKEAREKFDPTPKTPVKDNF